MASFFQEQLGDPEFARLFAQEQLIEEAAELVARAMLSEGITKSALAALVGGSRAHVTQLLAGTRNMTLRTLADLMHAMNLKVSLSAAPIARVPVDEAISFASSPRRDRYRWEGVEPSVCGEPLAA